MQNKQIQKKIGDYQFSLNDILGQGSFATVYKCFNSQNQLFAMKVIEKKSIDNDDYLYIQFLVEFSIQAYLKHQNVLGIKELYETSSNYYVVTEYCNMGNLRRLVEKKKFIPESQAIYIIVSILKGFQYIYNHNIVHRDLKAENILIHNFNFKIADFGFARKFSNKFMFSAVGTPIFMSPQILTQNQYSEQSEIWSLGIIFYNILTGKYPWFFQSNNDYIKNIANQPLTFPSHIQISSEMKNLIEQMLEINEKKRITLKQIIKTPIINNYFASNKQAQFLLLKEDFKKMIGSNNQLELNQVLIDLSYILKENLETLIFLFRKYSINLQMNFDQFQNMIYELDIYISYEEVEEAFRTLSRKQIFLNLEQFLFYLDKYYEVINK